MIVLVYLAGMVTPFVVRITHLAIQHALDRSHGLECVAEDLNIPTRSMTRIQIWFVWRWHRLTVGRKQWHRDAVAAYMAKWGR